MVNYKAMPKDTLIPCLTCGVLNTVSYYTIKIKQRYKVRRKCDPCRKAWNRKLNKDRTLRDAIWETDGGEWRDCPNHFGYQVSSLGNVRRSEPGKSARVGKMLKPQFNHDGYTMFSLAGGKRGSRSTITAHRLVADAFLPPKPGPRYEVAHNDGDRKNPSALNLRWDTHKGNHADQWKHGTATIGSKNNLSVMTEEQVLRARKLRKEGKTQREIGELLGINPGTIACMLRGKSWVWLKDTNG